MACPEKAIKQRTAVLDNRKMPDHFCQAVDMTVPFF
jgi:hypothetical protein